MIKVTVELEDMQMMIKDNDAYTVEDATDLASRAMTIVFGEDIELVAVTEDDNIYIQTDVPRDNIQHEGM
tara:strand:+ start:991 stop:1200 length:210 start_codon:yes stop_codon:yes gene_type:complete